MDYLLSNLGYNLDYCIDHGWLEIDLEKWADDVAINESAESMLGYIGGEYLGDIGDFVVFKNY